MDWLVVELMETVDIRLFDDCYVSPAGNQFPAK